MSPPEVIVIHDSDSDGCPQPGASSGHLAASRRHRSEPTVHHPRLSHPTERKVIDVDSDDRPLKRARTDRLASPASPAPPAVKTEIETDNSGTGELGQGNKGTATWLVFRQTAPRAVSPFQGRQHPGSATSMPLPHSILRTDLHSSPRTITKVVHGSAIESQYIPPRLGGMQKDLIWATACRVAQIQQRHEKATFLPVRMQQSHLRLNPSLLLRLSPLTTSFWLAGGAVNKIIQNAGSIAISSATSGGQPDDLEHAVQPQDNHYNREGTLQIWQDGSSRDQSIILHGHCVQSQSRTVEPTCHRCYTVNDISYDPNRSHAMASTGNDGFVQLWQDGKKVDNGCYKYPRAPYDVVYRDRDSLMAVTCMNGSVYVHQIHSHSPLGDPVELHVAPLQAHHSVGAIVWGQGASADTLFASSESQSTTDHTGYHIAFDADQGRPVYEFNAKESGDAMALDPDGVQLALCTASHDGTHFLRLYDVCRKNGKCPRQEIQLDAFNVGPGFAQPETHEGEVNTVKFSPDGLLLAVARSDDELHVYDSRFMGRSREPMQRFLHWGEDCCLGGDRWGIVDAVWVDGWCGRGLGVVTGGSDGCVRFWDVRRSADDISNGEVLAQPNSDIGHFSVGNPYNGEKPLVVGDNGGRIYVYDHATACR